MTMFAEQGYLKSRKDSAAGPRKAPVLGLLTAAGVLAVGLAVSPAWAQYRSNSGITINNNVLDSLGPGPAPLAPLPPTALPQAAPLPAPGLTPTFNLGGNRAPQPQANGAVVVTRPGTLLFPPLRNPSSSLTPGFATDVAREQRKQAFDSAFAEGPEPRSQLLLPLGDGGAGTMADQGEWTFETVIIESAPIPQPAPRKPAPSPAMLAALDEAEQQEPGLQEAVDESLPPLAVTPVETAELPGNEQLAPEFRQPEALSDGAVPDAPAMTAVATTAAEPAPQAELPAPAPDETPVQVAAAVQEAPADDAAPLSLLPPDTAAAPIEGTEAVSDAEPTASMPAPLQQTASLPDTAETAAPADDISFVFDPNSAELTTTAQATLRSLADDLRDSGGDRIQVLGFASSSDGSTDLARQLALSRALKVRTFLIDAGIPSARIQVRPPSGASDSGPANRVDIKPVGS